MAHQRTGSTLYDRRRFLEVSALGVAGAAMGAGCSGITGETASGGSAAGFPKRPINLIVAYEAGGGTDVGARLLQPYLEQELGGTVNVVNKPGGGGWVGWNALLAAKPDGYTIGFLNTPNLMSGAMNPDLGIEQELSDFALIGNVVTDYGAIAVRPDDDRFSTIEDLIAHAREHRLTSTSSGVGSDDQLSALGLNAKYKTRFAPIESEGAAEGVTAVLGGNIDVLFANVGEVKTLHDDRQIRVLAVMAPPDERADFLSDVPTLSEAGFPGVVSWSSRGLGAPGNVPDDIMRVLVEASGRAIQNKEYVQKLSKQGLLVNYLAPDAYDKMLKAEAERVQELGDRYVW